MVEIAPFKALRYNLKRHPSLSQIICPPYDVISITDYHRLMGRSPWNMVRVELPMTQGSKDKYEVAALFWKKWQNNKTLIREKEPCFYGYEQRFNVSGAPFVRQGFFAALRVEKPGRGRIRPHERTFPKHKADRLMLMRATRANISPIFGIYFDPQSQACKIIGERMQAKPLLVCRDDKGVTHRLWKWSDPPTIKALRKIVSSGDILIADGHHRYETSWDYAQERSQASQHSSKKTKAYHYVMTFLCSLTDPGLVIQPTHRAVRYQASQAEWENRITPYFILRKVPGLSVVMSRLRRKNEHSGMGLLLKSGPAYWLSPKDKVSPMPVVALHEGVLKDIPLEQISYGQNPREMAEHLMRGEYDAVFLLPPPDKEVFARICKAGRPLPQKSTYFYPKVTTGLVMRTLDGDVSDL